MKELSLVFEGEMMVREVATKQNLRKYWNFDTEILGEIKAIFRANFEVGIRFGRPNPKPKFRKNKIF